MPENGTQKAVVCDACGLRPERHPNEECERYLCGVDVCSLCEGEGQVVSGISIYSSSHAYPEIVTCPDCHGTGRAAPPKERHDG